MYAQSMLVSWNLVGMVGVWKDIFLRRVPTTSPPLPTFRDLVAPRRSRSLLVANDDDDVSTEESHRCACSNSRK